jgi:hypothetical protein
MKYHYDDKETERRIMIEVERCLEHDHCTVALQWMSPDKYMSMLPDQCGQYRCDRAPEKYFDDGSIKDLTEKMEKGVELDPPWIDLTDHRKFESILGGTLHHYKQEGRHRAFVARKLGIELIPVVVVQNRKKAEKCLLPKVD